MDETRKEADLRTIRERQVFIETQIAFLATQRSHQNAWILFARDAGATFQELGDALGVSWQAAQQRLLVAQEEHAAGVELHTPE